jgi:hypothetical protein
LNGFRWSIATITEVYKHSVEAVVVDDNHGKRQSCFGKIDTLFATMSKVKNVAEFFEGMPYECLPIPPLDTVKWEPFMMLHNTRTTVKPSTKAALHACTTEKSRFIATATV